MDDKERRGQDVRNVIREETSRGRRSVDTDAIGATQEKLAKCRELLEFGNEGDLRDAIRALGLKDGSPEFEEAVRIWRASH